MTDKLERDVNRGIKAANLLADELFAEASDHIEAECFRLFKTTHPTDTEALSQIAGIQYLHTKYKAFLKSAVTNGKVAQMEIERQSKFERMKRKVLG